MITNSEVAQNAQHLPSVTAKLLNMARAKLSIIVKDDIYEHQALRELLYAEIPEARADPEPVVRTPNLGYPRGSHVHHHGRADRAAHLKPVPAVA